ncbi:MAG: nicotinate (nicotinamide) nucleotide adenylyltransferase [Clostridia bacterium]|nr:nicotinate (nicotinamide) nucleotide adenylyltransferase [Clostridia bacterium]
MKRIAILGGTFSPVHIEHVLLAKSAIKELALDKLIVMPTFISPHKSEVPLCSSHRLNMLKLAFKDVEKVEVSDFEIEKQGKSYTYQTVEHFKSSEDAELFFIVGGDMLTDFPTWRYPERILSACTLAVFDREGFYTDYDGLTKYFMDTFGKTFIKLNHVGRDASSTKIRIYSALSLPLDNLTTKEVEEYIIKNRLYQDFEFADIVKKTLPEKRLIHTANVVICALKRAKELGLENKKVITATMLHDFAKYIDYKTVEGFTVSEDVPEPVIHAFLGAYLAEKHLKITDREVLDAIKYHTSGRPNMTTLEKLVFVADMVEDGRTYDGVEELRKSYNEDDFERCFFKCLEEETVHLINKKQKIYHLTLEAYNYYK